MQHRRLSKFKDKSDDSCTEADWEECLRALLLQDRPAEGVEATARITDDGYLFIEVHKRAPDQTVRDPRHPPARAPQHSLPASVLRPNLVSSRARRERRKAKALPDMQRKSGELKLRRSIAAESSIDIFDWCAEAVSARRRLERDVAELRRKQDDLQKLVAAETARFRELERSKHEFEQQHDSWLKDLLNEKKVKIRMQEQILATAHVDQSKLAAVNASKRRAAVGSSRRGKRKAEPELSDGAPEGDEAIDDVDEMDVDDDVNVDADPDSHEDVSDVGMATPGSETASASEPEASPAPEPQPNRSGRKGARASPAPTARGSKKAGKTRARAEAPNTKEESEDDLPPPKPLPATKKKPAVPADDESTASASD